MLSVCKDCLISTYKHYQRHIIYVIALLLLAVVVLLFVKIIKDKKAKKPLTLKDIQIEKLLKRKERKTDKALIDSAIKDKVVCVTGGAGSIGSEICRQVLNAGCSHLVVIDYHENGMFYLEQEFSKKYEKSKYTLIIATVREKEKIEQVFSTFKPQIVFHAAAYKHVPMMEFAPAEAIKTNLFGTKNVIECAERNGVEKFVLISTDKAVNPSSVMGATKRLAEMLIQTRGKSSKTKMSAVRFGNVLGSSGSVVLTFIDQINKGGPITLTDRNIKRYFMSIPEAVKLVIQSSALIKGGEVFTLDMGEAVPIYDLAVSLIKQAGYKENEDIKIEITGLRPGEKLFEELRYEKEFVSTTLCEDIFVNKLEDINEVDFNKHLDKLNKLAQAENDKEIEKEIFSIVPNVYRADN